MGLGGGSGDALANVGEMGGSLLELLLGFFNEVMGGFGTRGVVGGDLAFVLDDDEAVAFSDEIVGVAGLGWLRRR